MARSPHSEWGDQGEDAAAAYLRQAGYRILARRYRCDCGEIDIVALHQGIVVFVEVKARVGQPLADPEDAVDARRQGRLVRAASRYLGAHASGQRQNCRFDVIGVLKQDDGQVMIRHTEEAFDPTQVRQGGRRA